MLDTASLAPVRTNPSATMPPLPRAAAADTAMYQRARRKTAETLEMLGAELAPQRRVVHAGEVIYQAGEAFGRLFILNSGFFKIVNLSPDGREQVVGLKFRGDWLGFDGIANQ